MGTMKPCCMSHEPIADQSGTALDLNQPSGILGAYKSPHMQELRRQFMDNRKPANCLRCWNEENAGRTSKRQYSLDQYRDRMSEIDWDNPAPDQLWTLDLKLGNLCNLKCRICGTWSSSKWTQEDMAHDPVENKKLSRFYQMLRQGEWPERNDVFWMDLERVLPNITHMEFSGGEPFLVTRHYQVLQKAIDTGAAANMTLHYNTNATMVPDLEHVWSQFRSVEISFSIDNIGDRFDFERNGAMWSYVQKNIERFREMSARTTNIKLSACVTVNTQNVYYLADTVAWLDQQDFWDVFLNMLHDPKHMCVANMTQAAKDLVLPRLHPSLFHEKYDSALQGIRLFIEQGITTDGSVFKSFMDRADAYRGEDFQRLYPEMAKAMGYAA